MSKVAINNVYLVNKLAHNLILKGGYIRIPTGTFAKIPESDLEHPDVLDALSRDWVEAHTSVPDVSDLPKPVELIVEHEQYKGMTEEDLKNSSNEVKESGARSEALGRSDQQVEKTSEATSVAIGQSAEEANGVTKRGRKPAVTTE